MQRRRGDRPLLSSGLHNVARNAPLCSADEMARGGLIGPAILSRSGDVGDELELFGIAARQHGAFSISQARSAGFDRSAVHHRLSNGSWVRLDDSVYALASAPRTWTQTLWATVLSCPTAALTHWTACRLFGLDDIPSSRPVLLVPRGSNVRSGLARLVESDQFDEIAKTTVDGLPVTTMPETVLLLARDIGAERVTKIFDQAIVGGKLDLDAMSVTIDREAGRRTPGTP